MRVVNKLLRFVYNKYNQRKLSNRDVTLFSSNCNGGVILHDLGLRFNSPFVNLWIKPKDFIKICENPEYYLKLDLLYLHFLLVK